MPGSGSFFVGPDHILDPVKVEYDGCIDGWYGAATALAERGDPENGAGNHRQQQKGTTAVALTGIRSPRHVLVQHTNHTLVQAVRQLREAPVCYAALDSVNHSVGKKK